MGLSTIVNPEYTRLESVKLSVVIRCRNEGKVLRNTLSALHAQVCDFRWEVIVVNNESEDDSVLVAEEFGARVVHLPKHEFTFGKASNLGIAQAKGEIILMLSAHSIPFGPHFLEDCVVPFNDPEIASARTITSRYAQEMRSWYTCRTLQFKTRAEQDEFEKSPQWLSAYMNTSCGLLRKCVWEKYPFDEGIDASEDKFWVSNILKQGYKVQVGVPVTSFYLKDRSRQENIDNRYLNALALYRATGYSKVTLATFLRGLAGIIIRMPIYPFWHLYRYLADQIPFLLIPLSAKRPMKAGSLPRYERFD
jgi:rhamnosyltransferase